MNHSRQAHPVARAWHPNVGEKQPHVVPAVQQFQSGVSVLGLDDAEAVIFKRVGDVHAQKRFVLDYEDRWVRFHKARTDQRASCSVSGRDELPHSGEHTLVVALPAIAARLPPLAGGGLRGQNINVGVVGNVLVGACRLKPRQRRRVSSSSTGPLHARPR
jgi:hypothetical protein